MQSPMPNRACPRVPVEKVLSQRPERLVWGLEAPMISQALVVRRPA
jgi:hypothetical protein